MANDNSKVSKAEAHYRGSPNGPECCDKCTMFEPPQTCDTVNGKIVSAGWCAYFQKKKDADE